MAFAKSFLRGNRSEIQQFSLSQSLISSVWEVSFSIWLAAGTIVPWSCSQLVWFREALKVLVIIAKTSFKITSPRISENSDMVWNPLDPSQLQYFTKSRSSQRIKIAEGYTCMKSRCMYTCTDSTTNSEVCILALVLIYIHLFSNMRVNTLNAHGMLVYWYGLLI